MEDQNMVVSTSMMQYLEEVDLYLKENHVIKTESNLDPSVDNNFNLERNEFDFEFRRNPSPVPSFNLSIPGEVKDEHKPLIPLHKD